MSNSHAVYLGLFNALPSPATLIDRDGMIVDINPAFIEYARTLGRNVTRQDRIGRHICDFAEGKYLHLMQELVHDIFVSGTVRARQIPTDEVGHRHAYVEVEAMVIHDEAANVAKTNFLRT